MSTPEPLPPDRASEPDARAERVEDEHSTAPDEPEPKLRPPRRRRKRTRFKVPDRTAIAVRPLWEQASEDERNQAHRYAMAILESWTGRASWDEIAEQLGLPPVRVHQLSQQAVSGMLAGLLKQPRTRRKRGEAPPADPLDDPVLLRKQIRALETKLARTEDLVRVLQELPWHRGGTSATKEHKKEAPRGKKRVAGKAKGRAATRPKDESRREEGGGAPGGGDTAEGA